MKTYNVYNQRKNRSMTNVDLREMSRHFNISMGKLRKHIKEQTPVHGRYTIEPTGDFYYCQNNKCPNRGVENYDQPYLVYDEAREIELKMCSKCGKGVK